MANRVVMLQTGASCGCMAAGMGYGVG